MCGYDLRVGPRGTCVRVRGLNDSKYNDHAKSDTPVVPSARRIKFASRRPPGRGAGGSVQPVSRRPWCSGTIKRVCPQADPQARSCRASVRISVAESHFVRPTFVFQLKYADVLRAREISFRAKLFALLLAEFEIYGFRAQGRTCVKLECSEGSDRQSDVELYGPLGRDLRETLELPMVCSELASPLALLNADACKPRARIKIRSRSATMRFPAERRRSTSVRRRSATQNCEFESGSVVVR